MSWSQAGYDTMCRVGYLYEPGHVTRSTLAVLDDHDIFVTVQFLGEAGMRNCYILISRRSSHLLTLGQYRRQQLFHSGLTVTTGHGDLKSRMVGKDNLRTADFAAIFRVHDQPATQFQGHCHQIAPDGRETQDQQ